MAPSWCSVEMFLLVMLSVCSSGNFRCDDGLCKSLLNVWCNGEADCSDHTDEPLNCSCVAGQFKCRNGRCIPEYAKCDFVDDCLDGSDEVDCTTNCVTDDKLFQCANGQCLSRYSQCDGFADCQDGSDERDCTKNQANGCSRPGYFLCSNSSLCVPMAAWCDGIMDCPDHSDEPQFCSTICPSNSFSCDGGRCMPVSIKCDGKMDCVDKADETGCQCQENELPLPNSACLAKEKFCNGVKDAANGLDEEQCTTCKDRLRRDLPRKLCDGVIDCPDSSDELFCGGCTTAQFYCIKSRQCIFRNQTCDGYPDCSPFGEDEETCLGVTPLPCHIDTDMSSIQPERAGCLTVRNRGDWMPVCAERWLSSLSDAICEIMGYDKSLSTNLIPMDPSEIIDRPVKIPRQIEGPQLVISAAMNCPSRKKVYLECGSLLCGQSLPDNGLPRFFPGYNKVSDGKHPWSVMLYKDGKYVCSAVVIDAEYVLTSAKCVISVDIGSSYIVARLGMTRRLSRNGNEQFIPVDYIAVHPNYSVSINPGVSSADADLALLHLDVPVHWNSFVKPVCLPRSTDPPENVALIGWSVVRGQRIFSTEESLQEVTVNTLNTTFCMQNPLVERSINGNVFCANFSGISPGNCTTDPGGPALNKDNFGRWSVVGVASFTLGCNQTGAVAGFVNVAKHRTWINDILTKSKKPDLPQDRLCIGGYRCEVGTCINPSQRCDGVLDCPLGSDEYGCISPLTQNQTGSCNFSDATLCGYRQDLGDSLNFYRGNVGDASFLADREKWLSTFSGSFLYVSSLMSNTGKGVARLISPRMNVLPFTKCLQLQLVSTKGNLTIYDFADPSRVYLAQRKGDTTATTSWTIPQNTSAFVLEAKLSNDKDSFLAIGDFILNNQSCVI